MKLDDKIYNIMISNHGYKNKGYLKDLAKLSDDETLHLLSNALHSRVSIGKDKFEPEANFVSRMIGLKESYSFIRSVYDRGINEIIFKDKKINKFFLLKYIEYCSSSKYKENKNIYFNDSEFNIVDHVLDGIDTKTSTTAMYLSLLHFMRIAANRGWIRKDVDSLISMLEIKLITQSDRRRLLDDYTFFSIFMKDIMEEHHKERMIIKLKPDATISDIKQSFLEVENVLNELTNKISIMAKNRSENYNNLRVIYGRVIELCEYFVHHITMVNKDMPEDDKIKVSILEGYLSLSSVMLKNINNSNLQSIQYFTNSFKKIVYSNPMHSNVDPKFIIDNLAALERVSEYPYSLNYIIKHSKAYVR